jgi:drug/metabolite transporter (DMT)-like permease
MSSIVGSRIVRNPNSGIPADSVERVRRPTTVDLMLLTTVLLWAFNFTVTKYVLTHGFRPLAYSSIRYGAAATIFAAITHRREGSLAVRGPRVAALLGAASVGILCNQLAYVYAIKLTTATTVALILGTTPIFTALIAWAVRLERLARRFWIAAVFSFLGVALVAIGTGGGLSGDVGGDALAVVTAMTWAAYSVTIAPLMRRFSPWRISAVVLLAGWVPLALAASRQLLQQDYSFPWLVWVGLAYAVIGPLVLTNVLWFTAIHRVGPSRATLFANIQPFIAAIFALLILSESMTRLQVAGGLAIGAGIVLSRGRSAIAVPREG